MRRSAEDSGANHILLFLLCGNVLARGWRRVASPTPPSGAMGGKSVLPEGPQIILFLNTLR